MIDLKAFSEQQQSLGARAASLSPRVVRVPGKDDAHLVVNSSGELIPSKLLADSLFFPPAGPRKYSTLTLASFVAIVNEFATRNAAPDKVFVFASMSQVVAVLSEADRRETVTFPLATTSSWQVMRSMRGSSAMTQAAFIDMLRRGLDATYTPPDLLSLVRIVKFKQNESGESNIQTGKASIGRSVQSELTGAGALPEDVRVNVPVWDNVMHDDILRNVDVICALDIDLEQQRFYLRPKAGQIESHERDALDWLVGLIAEQVSESVSVYAGSPN